MRGLMLLALLMPITAIAAGGSGEISSESHILMGMTSASDLSSARLCKVQAKLGSKVIEMRDGGADPAIFTKGQPPENMEVISKALSSGMTSSEFDDGFFDSCIKEKMLNGS